MNQSGAIRPKAEWREFLKSMASGNSALVIEQLNLFLQNESGNWAGYNAFQSEIDFSEVYLKTQNKINWAFPFISDLNQKKMDFRQGFQFEKSPFGFAQPVASAPIVELQNLKGVIVPGLGFDSKGYRIGRGQGYYDRALESFKGIKVGVCFSNQIVDFLPVETFDVQMNVIVSEKGISWLT